MSTELTMLVWSSLLALLMPFFYVVALFSNPGGFKWGLGNRDQPLVGDPPWAARGRRAHSNLIENLVPFAALVLVAHVTGRTNSMTALGAELFFWGRLAYAAVYMAGLVPWRTVMFSVASLGEFLILFQLL